MFTLSAPQTTPPPDTSERYSPVTSSRQKTAYNRSSRSRRPNSPVCHWCRGLVPADGVGGPVAGNLPKILLDLLGGI